MHDLRIRYMLWRMVRFKVPTLQPLEYGGANPLILIYCLYEQLKSRSGLHEEVPWPRSEPLPHIKTDLILGAHDLRRRQEPRGD